MNTNVYIGSLPRSGTTLLGMMLNQHSNIFNMGESFFWKKYDPNLVRCSCGLIGCSVLTDVFSRAISFPEIMSIYDVVEILDRFPESGITVEHGKIDLCCLGLEKLADIFRQIIPKQIMVDVSTNIRVAQGLAKRLNWKILLLVRDPRGVLYSYKAQNIRYNRSESLAQKVKVFKDFARHALVLRDLPNVLFLRYEDICSNPWAELVRISDFLQIGFEPAMLKFYADKGHTVMGNRLRFGDTKEVTEDLAWIMGLTEDEKNIILLNREIVEFYSNFDYCLNSGGEIS